MLLIVLLIVLVLIFIRLQHIPSDGWQDAVKMDGTIGLYLGWVTVATIAKITAWLVDVGFMGFGRPADTLGVALLVAGVAIAASLSVWSRG